MSFHHPADPSITLRLAQQRQAEDAARAAEWRMTRGLVKSQKAARKAERPVRDGLVEPPLVPVGNVFKLWWRGALRAVGLAS